MNGNKKDDIPLPLGWSKLYSKSAGRYYYSHAETKHTQWHWPTASEVQNPNKAKERALKNEQEEARKQRGGGQDDEDIKPQKMKSAAISDEYSPSKRKESEDTSDAIRLSTDYLHVHSLKNTPKQTKRLKMEQFPNSADGDSFPDYTATCVAIIVPFRDIHPEQNRAAHLAKFIPHMHTFLKKQLNQGRLVDYHIYIVEQSNDGRKFNRGKLLNIGFDIAKKNKIRVQGMIQSTQHSNGIHANVDHMKSTYNLPMHDAFIFHDVDLLPNDDLALYYTNFPKAPTHIARVWDRYSNNPKYFGGIVSFTASDMKRINGYPNNFWGWGGEDDEMQKRCEALGIKWDFPTKGTIIDLENMDLKKKLDLLRSNKSWKCMTKWEALEEHEKTWKSNGLSDLSYSILKTTDLDLDRRNVDRSRATLITVDVKLNGNHWTNEKCGIDFVEKS